MNTTQYDITEAAHRRAHDTLVKMDREYMMLGRATKRVLEANRAYDGIRALNWSYNEYTLPAEDNYREAYATAMELSAV